jgi:4-amino-4-deoxy-L-arabinose transferase-like glycosyltransferase
LIGILTVLGIFFLGRELFDERAGLLASFITATSFWHIMFSRIGFRAITAPFFLTFALVFLLIAVRRAREKEDVWLPTLFAALGGLSFGLGFYSYISYRTAPLLLLPFIYFFKNSRGFWRVLSVFLAVTFVTALPIGIYYLGHPGDFLGRTSQVSIFSGDHPFIGLTINTVKVIGMFFVWGDMNWRQNYAGMPQLFWPVALLFLVGFLLAVRKIIVRAALMNNPMLRFSSLLLLLWILIMALPVIVSNEGIPHALRGIIMIPPVMLLASLGGMVLYDKFKDHYSRTLRIVIVSFFLALLPLQAYNMYFLRWAKNPNVPPSFAADVTALAYTIRDASRAKPIYIVADGGGIDANIYNFKDGNISKVGFPLSSQVVMFITDTFTPEKQREKQIYYLTPDREKEIPQGAVEFTIH